MPRASNGPVEIEYEVFGDAARPTLLIVNGLVVDGTGAPARQADVRIRDGRIAEIGSGLAAQGEQVIDAAGAVVAPGFIDSHTHYDATIYWDPMLDPMPQHGVTTVVAGNCSLGLAPMRPADRADQIDLVQVVGEDGYGCCVGVHGEFRDPGEMNQLGRRP